jgi:hypothetical protein
VDDWFNEYLKMKEPIEESKKSERTKQLRERFTETAVREAYFKTKKENGFLNSPYNNKVIFNNSFVEREEFDAINLLKKEKLSKTIRLKEENESYTDEDLQEITLTETVKIPKPRKRRKKKKENK